MFGNNAKDKSTLLSVVLVIAESLLSLLIRFNKPLKTRLLPLVAKDLVVCIRTYLPHYVFFLSFTEKGVLFDSQLPETRSAEDVLVTGSSITLVRLLLTGDETLVKKLQFRGESHEISLLQECVENMGLRNVMQDMFENIKDFTPEKQQEKQQALSQFQAQVSLQENTIESLNHSLAASQAQTTSLQKHIRMLLGFIVLLLVAMCVLLVYVFL